MSLHRDLLQQARHLANNEPRRPKQASLRRATSSDYYALFHLLVFEATGRFVSGSNRQALRSALGRFFSHGEMKNACAKFAKGELPPALQASLGGTTLQAELKAVAAAFVELQQARHDADYNTEHRFTRPEVADLMDLTDQSFADWNTVRATVQGDVFLVALLIGTKRR